VSYDLYVWMRPVVETTDEANALIHAEDESDFEPSPEVRDFYDELLRRWPAEGSPVGPPAGVETNWGLTVEPSDRLVVMNFTWSVPDDVVEAVVELARERDLVLYDPQGPEFYSPPSLDPPPLERRDRGVLLQALKALLVGTATVAGAWFLLPVPVLDWILIVAGGFLVVMALLSIVAWLRE
jgi:hypothetical protein